METSSASGVRRNISPRAAKAADRGGKSSSVLRSADRDRKQIYKPKPISLFSTTHIPKPLPASRVEKAQLRYLKEFRTRVRNGPLYAVLTEESRTGYKRTAVSNPFEDVDHYTKKFKPEIQTLAKFDTHEYCIHMFPDELHDVLRPGKSIRRRKARDATRAERSDAEYIEETQQDAEDGAHEADDDALSETNVDDDFEDNDSDMAGDYNAEGYFDGGEDDGDVLDGDGGDDGGGYD